MPDKKQLNRLKQAEAFKLCQFVLAHHETFNNRTGRDVAAEATEKLGFFVTKSNLVTAQGSTEVDWVWKRENASPNAALDARVAFLEDRLAVLEEIVTNPSLPGVITA